MAKKAQSAMEYLMTYGWAVLAIAVALGVLYYIGVFNGSASVLSNSCEAQQGFLCSNIKLNSSGAVSATIGLVGSTPITITGIACTNTS
ncbi:MAG: hypothetical protein QXF01_02775, partial [Candidatus Micrarchaeaceae archaeon]